MDKACLGETHATGHGPDDRGGRSQEVMAIYSTAHAPVGAEEPEFHDDRYRKRDNAGLGKQSADRCI